MTMLSFNLGDVLCILGLAQSLYLLVYILFRAGSGWQAVVPSLCFGILSLAFFCDFAVPRLDGLGNVVFIRSAVWVFVPAFSVLMINQVVHFGRWPTPRYWLIVAFPILSVLTAWLLNGNKDILEVGGLLSGCICFLTIWLGRESFSGLKEDKSTKGERYWLIVSFILTNLLIMGATLLDLSQKISGAHFILVRDVLGIGMVYLASTSLLRIYPQSVRLVEKKPEQAKLSNEDKGLIDRIQNLIELDKVYQEPNFQRADLARELDVPEAKVSRLINVRFGKSLTQVVNELRVRDSLQLLEQTEAAVSIVAQEVGFNSLPTFNRVFKDIMNVSPSEYRQKNKKIG